MEEGDSSDEEVEEGAEPLSDSQIAVRACAGLAAGLATCAYFSDPLVEALSDLSKVPPPSCLHASAFVMYMCM